jgi:phospholipid/cholesterol/gamma-HCH transport system ATP-binding protein
MSASECAVKNTVRPSDLGARVDVAGQPTHRVKKFLTGREARRDETLGQERAPCARRETPMADAVDADRGRVDLAEVEQELDEGGLARAVQAGETEHVAGANLEIDFVQHPRAAVAPADSLKSDRRLGHSASPALFEYAVDDSAVWARREASRRRSTLKCEVFKAPTVPPDNLVEIENVTFGYDQRKVLHGIDLTVPKGAVVAIMGLSGCGKTTLLRLIAGAIRPTHGEVRVAGTAVNRLSDPELFALRRKMGMLFQFGALFTDMSVFDNVAFQMREHTDLPAQVVRDLVLMKLEAVGLRGAAELMPSELSGGMARRVALARTIALDPRLIMYDEPFAGLDPVSLGVIGQLIRKLNDALGATSIVVTHDVAEALEIVDYVYYMSAGRIEFRGTPDEVRASRHPSLRQFAYGEPDGPVPFHYPAADYRADVSAETG